MKKLNQRNFSAKGARPTEYLPDQQKIQQFQNRPATAIPGSKQNGIISQGLPPAVPIDEKLSSEIIELKNRNNEIISENVKLKTKATMSERDLKKYEKIFDEVQNTGVIKGQQQAKVESGSNYLAGQLKKQLKELRLELQFKEEQMEKMKKTVKVTRLQEIEIEKKQFTDEAIRLKSYLEQVMQENMQVMIQQQNYSTLEEQYYQQYNNLNQNKQYIEQLKQSLQSIDQENNEILGRIQKISQLNEETRKKLNEKDYELQRLRNDYQQIVDSKQKIFLNSFGQPQKLQKQKENVNKQQQQQQNDNDNQDQQKLKEKDRKIQELNEKIRELEQKFFSDQQSVNMKQQTNLSQLKKQEEDYRQELIKLEQENSKLQVNVQQSSTEQQQELRAVISTSEQEEKITVTEITEEKDEIEQAEMQKQAKDHILLICKELRYKLIMNNISRNKLPEYLFAETKSTTDYPMLLSVLLNPPFNFEQNAATLLSTYLIQGSFPLDLDSINGVKQKKETIIKNLDSILEDYQIIANELQNPVIERYKSVFLDPGMKSNLQLMNESSNTQQIMKCGGIEGILSVQSQKFSETEIDFLFGKLLNFSKKHSINELLIQDLINFFQELASIQPLVKAQRPHSAVQHSKQMRQQQIQQKLSSSSSSGSAEVVIVEEEPIDDEDKYKTQQKSELQEEKEEKQQQQQQQQQVENEVEEIVDEEIKEESFEQSKGQKQQEAVQENLSPVDDDYEAKFDDDELVEELIE